MSPTSSASGTTGWPGRLLRAGYIIFGLALAVLTAGVVGGWAPIAAPLVFAVVALAGEMILRRAGLVGSEVFFWVHDRK